MANAKDQRNPAIAPPADPPKQDSRIREINYSHSQNFADILAHAGVSVLISTYQAGKLVVLGTIAGKLTLSLHNFDQAMGISVHPKQIAVGGRSQIWSLHSTPDIVKQWSTDEPYDSCYLTRRSHVTGEIDAHEMCWCGDELWVVNTRFSCLCTIAEPYSFVPRWKPRFISQLVPEDRCHLNGLCVVDGQPAFVTAMSETDSAAGWRANKSTSGCLIDVVSGETITRGFAMPHSPRVYNHRLWTLDSGRGRMVMVDPKNGDTTTITQQPGYTRGLDFAHSYAFIGLSRIRETSTFGGVPIAEHRESLKCGIAIVDLKSGKHLAHFEFTSGVEEIFDVRVLPNSANPYIQGPLASADEQCTIWFAPPLETSFRSTQANKESEVFLLAMQHASRDQLEQAEALFRQVLELSPQHVDAHWNLGVALLLMDRIEEAVASLRRAIELRPELPAAHLNLSMALFLSGDLSNAWREYQWRWQCDRFGRRGGLADSPQWQGQSLKGKSVLIYGEQGIGDEIMFASCFHALIQVAEKTTIACEPRLVPIFQRSFPESQVVSSDTLRDQHVDQHLGEFDYQTASGDLPQHVRSDLRANDASERYLVADKDAMIHWKKQVSRCRPRRLIGISWRGGSTSLEQQRRSTLPSQWTPILNLPSLCFVNLQYGTTETELKQFEDLLGDRLFNFSEVDALTDIDSFAALIASLDLVISVDNSTAHLAGALGIPTWVLLSGSSASYWRWLREGDRSGWYSSVRLFRKRFRDSWEPLFNDLASLLHEASPHKL